MSKENLSLFVSENPEYTFGKRKAIVTPIYKKDGENICEILLKLMCREEREKSETA